MKALKGFRATDISLMVLLFFHAICAIITGTLLPQIIKEFSIDYATAGSIETLRSYAILFRGCPACFLILKGVVISSHETNRFS